MPSAPGPSSVFTISIDFELFWGTRDHRSLADYEANILGGREAVPELLSLFEEFDVHATWAVVGFVLYDDANALSAHLPRVLPEYGAPDLSPYRALDRIRAEGESAAPWYFAPALVRRIRETRGQEVASHTFSHYYCLEPGQTLEAFTEDLRAMRDAARDELGERVESLVFPRNQFNESYLAACGKMGIKAYRGNPRSWAYEPRNEGDESLLRRAVRLADSYVNLTGHHAHDLGALAERRPFDVPASRFLRPFSRRLRALEPIRLRRIRGDLDHAAENGLLYHLWWHPENFGKNTAKNLSFLRKVLIHFAALRRSRGMQSLTMREVASVLEARTATPAMASGAPS